MFLIMGNREISNLIFIYTNAKFYTANNSDMIHISVFYFTLGLELHLEYYLDCRSRIHYTLLKVVYTMVLKLDGSAEYEAHM